MVITGTIRDTVARNGSRKKSAFGPSEKYSSHPLCPQGPDVRIEWGLRFAYGFKADNIRSALTKLFGLPNVHLENPEKLNRVLRLYRTGLDFADAMHLAANMA